MQRPSRRGGPGTGVRHFTELDRSSSYVPQRVSPYWPCSTELLDQLSEGCLALMRRLATIERLLRHDPVRGAIPTQHIIGARPRKQHYPGQRVLREANHSCHKYAVFTWGALLASGVDPHWACSECGGWLGNAGWTGKQT